MEDLKRHRCPFYGFTHPDPKRATLVDEGDNQCGLTGGDPCYMERERGISPNWPACELLEKAAKERIVDDLNRKGTVIVDGKQIPFREWMTKVVYLGVPQ